MPLTTKVLEITEEIGTRYLGVARQETLADVVGENGWKIHSKGHQNFPIIYEKINAFELPNLLAGPDRVLWRYDHDLSKIGSIQQVLGVICEVRRAQ
ncbi:hypothetical protein HID58_060125 [Brassica napus]|uniref:Uncharacterized protein n=1 Tax=Brassica napus TaxID=3708 RepID=A0ABQ7ZUS5_BRANA|nr:hypothetical protein HID58_060125 [Brassica napus]